MIINGVLKLESPAFKIGSKSEFAKRSIKPASISKDFELESSNRLSDFRYKIKRILFIIDLSEEVDDTDNKDELLIKRKRGYEYSLNRRTI